MSFQRHRGAACRCLICFAFICAEGDFLLCHHGVILCPAHPGSEHTLDPFYLLLEASFFFSLYSSIPALFLFKKVVIIFQAAVVRTLGSAGVQKHSRVSSSANSVHKSPSQGLSAFHYSPYTFTGLSAWPIYLIIPLENCSVLLFCCPPACVYMACVYVCICVLVVGPSTCVALNL